MGMAVAAAAAAVAVAALAFVRGGRLLLQRAQRFHLRPSSPLRLCRRAPPLHLRNNGAVPPLLQRHALHRPLALADAHVRVHVHELQQSGRLDADLRWQTVASR